VVASFTVSGAAGVALGFSSAAATEAGAPQSHKSAHETWSFLDMGFSSTGPVTLSQGTG
jgi:hypothetical protein